MNKKDNSNKNTYEDGIEVYFYEDSHSNKDNIKNLTNPRRHPKEGDILLLGRNQPQIDKEEELRMNKKIYFKAYFHAFSVVGFLMLVSIILNMIDVFIAFSLSLIITNIIMKMMDLLISKFYEPKKF